MKTQRASWWTASLLALPAAVYCGAAGGEADKTASPPEPPPLTVGQTAGDWSLSTPSGRTVSFYEDSGDKASVIIFWATWCPVCRKWLPELAKLQASLPEGSANFYALNIAEDGDPVAYFASNGYKFQLLLKAEDVAKEYGMFGTPRVLVVDSDKVVSYALGKGTSIEQLIADLRAILK